MGVGGRTGRPESISFEVLMQSRDLSNFRGQRWGSEELGAGTWLGRQQKGLREDFGVLNKRSGDGFTPVVKS